MKRGPHRRRKLFRWWRLRLAHFGSPYHSADHIGAQCNLNPALFILQLCLKWKEKRDMGNRDRKKREGENKSRRYGPGFTKVFLKLCHFTARMRERNDCFVKYLSISNPKSGSPSSVRPANDGISDCKKWYVPLFPTWVPERRGGEQQYRL